MIDHSTLKALWKPGQRWETRVVDKVPKDMQQWIPIPNLPPHFGEPLWDPRQEYRLVDSPDS